jgi:gamma-glutamyltranspeptidase / glutathione hydrolase
MGRASPAMGVVASQHRVATRVGAEVLAEGGNAVDAAIAASMALGVVEPWMSGLGGGGFMLVQRRGEPVGALDFGMPAPQGIDAADYPLAPGRGSPLFPWPTVLEDRNVSGPLSIGVPGQVAGLALAHERYGTLSWERLVTPSVALAERGLPVNWYTALRIIEATRDFRRFPASRRMYLPRGVPPLPGGRRPLGPLPATLRRLAREGPRDFYAGAIAHAMVEDVQELGGRLSLRDLASYRAELQEPVACDHAGRRVHAMPGMTAGPTYARCLELLRGRIEELRVPSPEAYVLWAEVLFRAWEERLATMGDVADAVAPGCTSHLSVIDAEGSMVSLTQSLLSSFGSKVVGQRSGVLLNNAMMWFNPVPGHPNSIAPGKRPLSNMCPILVEDELGPWLALGAAGGRRILACVLQVGSLVMDGGLDLGRAFATPRIDVSGGPRITASQRLDRASLGALRARFPVDRRTHRTYPNVFARPTAVMRGDEGAVGMADPMTHFSGIGMG